MFEAGIAAILLLVFGAGILRLVGNVLLTALGLMMSAAIFAFKLVCVFFGVLAALIYMVLRQLVPFVAQHLAVAIPWVISALVAAGLIFYALGRKILHGESVTAFVEKLIPPREIPSRGTDFSLLVIELADSIHTEIVSKLEAQLAQVREIFRPLSE